MVSEFLIYPLYLFYGMAFFAIGVSITSRDTSTSNLKIARPLWLFALFAYSHAFLEWFALYLILLSSTFPEKWIPTINATKLGLVFVSFSFLMLFGMNALGIAFPKKRTQLYLIPALLIITMCLTMPFTHWDLSTLNMAVIDLQIRHFIGFPGAAIASLGLIFYSKTVHHISNKGASNFIGAGVSLAIYSILAGVVPSGTFLPLMGGIPVELFRGLSAFAILHFFMNALHTFDVERKLLIEERLNRYAQSEKLNSLGKLALGIAHEINNPLGNISMNVEMLKNDLQSKDLLSAYEKRFSSISRNLDRAAKIAGELQYFSTNEESAFQSTDLNEVIKSTLELLGSRQSSYQISLELKDIPLIQAIPWKLEEVFLNVIVNAMDAMQDGGSLIIASRQAEDGIVVKISDDGPGISTEHMPNVLDPFFTTKEVGKGTGLGLSICFGIMEMHKGTIALESHDGEGTTVSLSFPIGVETDA